MIPSLVQFTTAIKTLGSASCFSILLVLLPLLQAQPGPEIELSAGGAAIGGIFIIGMLLIGLASFVVWVWALIHAIRNPNLDSNMRLIWILVIIFGSGIGAIVYLLAGRK